MNLATRGTQIDARNRNRRTNDAREHHNMTRLWRTDHCDNRLTNRYGETPHRIPQKTMEKEPNVTCFRSAPRPCVCTYLPKWRVRAQSERARSKTAHDTAPAHRLPHVTTNTEMLKQTMNERTATQDVHSTTQKTVQRRKGTSSPEDQDSQFRCCLFQAIVKWSCLGILWQSRFAHDLTVSRSVSGAEHDNRQL